MFAKLTELVRNYRERINPPYSRRDLPAILATAFLVLILSAVLFFTLRPNRFITEAAKNNQIVFLNPQTLQRVESITNPTVKVLLTAPWPISFVGEGEVAGESDSKNQSVFAKSTSGTPNVTPESSKEQVMPPSTEAPKSPSTTPVPAITTSIVLAEDVNFSQNLMTISPVTSNPYLATYTFSNANPGTKILHVKFVSSLGNSLTYNNSIQLVSSISPPPAGDNEPIPNAPLCSDSGAVHDNVKFHTLWDSVRGCHYDHEHGENPFTAEVANAFPGFELRTLLGNVEIGHTNLSSPMENTMKHGGFKWQATLATPQNCAGFEGATQGVNAAVIQYHNFGDYSIELEGRIHTSASLIRQCNSSNPTDYGYLYVPQFQEYGQRVVPYQGTVFNYPNTPQPAFDSGGGPYLSVNCIGDVPQCRSSLTVARRNTAASNWTSKPTGRGVRPTTSGIFRLLFRISDTYQNYDWNDQEYPFTFLWICSSDGGRTYSPVGCEYNNSTTQVHEIAGDIPASWDNLAGFDTDSRVGRITAQGYVTRFGDLATECDRAGIDCHPIKMLNAFVGSYGSVLFFTEGKGQNLGPLNPERDIYFCNGQVCSDGDPGATPSGWIGKNN